MVIWRKLVYVQPQDIIREPALNMHDEWAALFSLGLLKSPQKHLIIFQVYF